MYTFEDKCHTGMVYAMTNAISNNEVIAFRRGVNGTLTRVAAYETGGCGTGPMEISPATPPDGIDPLASQGSLILSPDGNYLFAVNAGSNSISCFRVANNGRLALIDVISSGGAQPNSLAVCRNLLYVSNVGDAANNFTSNITGFYLWHDGNLTRITGSANSLSTPNAQPACVTFSPCGRHLVVSELTTNRLSVFHVNMNGTVTGPTINDSRGEGPFGCYFLSTGILLVAEAGANALSSYTISANGTLTPISASIPSNQSATCWVVASRNERYAYTSNTGSGTITLYHIKNNGKLTVKENFNSTPAGFPVGGPIDSGVSRDGCNFYVLNGNQGSITVFRIRNGGRLTRVQVVTNQGLPELGAQGLAVR